MIACVNAVERVSLTLPPPSRLGGQSVGPEGFPPATEKALGKLLAACGLETHHKGKALNGHWRAIIIPPSSETEKRHSIVSRSFGVHLLSDEAILEQETGIERRLLSHSLEVLCQRRHGGA